MHRAPVGLADEARGRWRRPGRSSSRRPRTPTASTPGFGRFVSESIPRRPGRGAAAAPAAQPRVRRRRAVSAPRSCARRCCCARTRSRRATRARAIETVELLIECLNRGVLPRVPARGSVGASGDLAPLAHLALPLVGEGQAWFEGTLLPGAEALRRPGSSRCGSRAKEGLSLINGTQFMAAMAALALVRAWRLARTADLACALSLESLQGSRTSFHPGDPPGAAAARTGRLGRQPAPAARGLGDHRVPPLVR